MINLLVDEAYAFDYLSVLEVKKQKSSISNDAWAKCYVYLQNQFDNEKWSHMMHSKEYENMIKANELTFDAVDKGDNAFALKATEAVWEVVAIEAEVANEDETGEVSNI